MHRPSFLRRPLQSFGATLRKQVQRESGLRKLHNEEVAGFICGPSSLALRTFGSQSTIAVVQRHCQIPAHSSKLEFASGTQVISSALMFGAIVSFKVVDFPDPAYGHYALYKNDQVEIFTSTIFLDCISRVSVQSDRMGRGPFLRVYQSFSINDALSRSTWQ